MVPGPKPEMLPQLGVRPQPTCVVPFQTICLLTARRRHVSTLTTALLRLRIVAALPHDAVPCRVA
jgi:hypothetical protein